MPILALLAVLLIATSTWRRRTGADSPQRIVTTAANLMPPARRDWGQAMIAELAQINGPTRRWRFSAGVVRVVVFSPPARRRQVLVVAITSVLVAAAGTATAVWQVPSVAVFVAVFCPLLGAYATVSVARRRQPHRSTPPTIVAVTAVVGLAATVITVIQVAVDHPAATIDHSHKVVTILFALILTVYLPWQPAARRSAPTSTPRCGGP